MPLRLSIMVLAAALSLAPQAALAANCRHLAGKYFSDVHNRTLTAAIKSRLGGAYKRFDDRYQVQVPFEATGDGYVYAPACMAHNCTVDEAFLGIKESTCKVFVALLENGHYTMVAPPSGWPASLDQQRHHWMNRE